MMSTNCPNCNFELNEQGECARCAQVASPATFAQAEDAAERDLSYGGAPVDSDDEAETDPAAVTPSSDEFSASPAEVEAASAVAHPRPDVGGSSDEAAGDDWAVEGPGDDALPDEAYEEAEEDALPPTAAESYSTTLNEHSSVEQIFNAPRARIFITRQPPPAPKDDERTLIDFTEALPAKNPRLPEFVFEELSENLDKLKEERLVLISCPDEDVAYSAAHALIDGLNLPQGRQRLLNVDRSAGEDWPLSIYYLSGKRDSEDQMVVLVDAATERARPFLEPIIRANRSSSDAIKDDLRRNHMYMLCLLDPSHLDDGPWPDDGRPRPARDLKFHCWRIPFLHRLLERYIDQPEEVERLITAQRADGRWSLDDSQFYFEVKSYLLRRELPAELDRRAKTLQRSPEEIFKGEDRLSATVVYLATYFPNLTAPEFNRLVPLLCADAAGGADSDADTRAESGAHVRERLQVWRTAPDDILKDCSLITIPLSDATRGVNFSNHNLRDRVREYLERDYNFFLENRFRDVQKLGLIFSPSARVAQSAVQLCVEKAAAYPEYYGSGWLAELVTDFEIALANTAPGAAFAWRFISEPNTVKARKQVYQGLAELIRALSEHPQPRAAEVAEGFLQQLLLTKHRGAVMEIVGRLQFATSFDQFKWLKQLLDQGTPQIRDQTSDYLRGHLRRIRRGVYPALNSLELWLPKDARPLKDYPIPARHALRVINYYFRETNSRFDARYFGAWPSAHPLFAFNDAATAAVNLGLLVRLLFHPGMHGVYKEEGVGQARGITQTNRLVTYWFYVLEGRGESVPRGRGGDASATELDATTVSDLLLDEIARGASAAQQAALAAYWQAERERLLKAMSNKPHGGAAWRNLVWRRELVVRLIKRFEPSHRRAAATR
jgi:hypothetical protein